MPGWSIVHCTDWDVHPEQYVKARAEMEDTYVIFMSDNGVEHRMKRCRWWEPKSSTISTNTATLQ